MAPNYPITKPFFPPRTSSASARQPQPLSSPALSTSSTSSNSSGSSPSSPRSPLARSPTTEPTLFSRIRPSRSRSPSTRLSSRANSSPTQLYSPTSAGLSPTSDEYPLRSRLHTRSDSSPTIRGPVRQRSRSAKRHSGTVMQCGRHGNDWLFGGFSFTDTVRNLVKGDGENEHEQGHGRNGRR